MSLIVFVLSSNNPHGSSQITTGPKISVKNICLRKSRAVNPHTGKMERASSKARLKMNPHTGKMEYAEPGARLRMNPHTGKMEFATNKARPKINVHTNQMELSED
jgi:hypothetical protein